MNGSHDVTILSVSISDVTIITIKNVDYHCIIRNLSISRAFNLLESSILEDRGYVSKMLF